MPMISRLAILGVASLLAPTPALAAGPGTGGVNCSLTATPLTFGPYTPSSNRPADFTATLKVICTAPSATPAAIHATIALLGDSANRQLAAGAEGLRYQLYLDPGRTIVWGDGTGGGSVVSLTGFAERDAVFRQTVTVYGRILARQSRAGVGAYSDRIVAILDY